MGWGAAIGNFFGRVGGAIVPKLAVEGAKVTIPVIGTEVVGATAAKWLGGTATVLAAKGALDIVSPDAPQTGYRRT